MIDIHSHILPAIDDGAESLSVAAKMCRLAAEDGCTAILATPHQRTPSWWNCEPAEMDRSLDELRAAVGNTPELHLGAEIRVDSLLLEALVDIDESGIVPLAGSRYLLLEFNRRGLGRLDPEGLTHELRLQGWRPIYAHPEFVPEFSREPDPMQRVIERGGLFQVTAMSLTGGFGRRIRTRAEGMVAAGLVHFIASDAHDLAHRPPGLRRVHELLSTKHSKSLADRLTLENPRAVLDNRPIESEPTW